MTKLMTSLALTLPLAPAVSGMYTGFNYGAFWGIDSNAKTAADFQTRFTYAQNLSSRVPFNSARLFTCKMQGTVDEPSGAFDAAVETETNLLLGFWITPQNRSGSLDDIVKNEMSALGKGFQKHGQALADLIIGLSVGSEDIYRWEDTQDVGVSATEVSAIIKKVKISISSSSFAAYMRDKPIGHVDTAKHAVVDGADFYGMTVYPYWNRDPITKGKESFAGTMNNIKQRAGNTPIWIAEMGWPYEGAQQGAAVASAENLQQYWTEVGCSVVGMYNMFWFELTKDSEFDQPDWGLLDPVTHKPRIDLSCPEGQSSAPVASASSSPGSLSFTLRSAFSFTTLITLASRSVIPASLSTTQPSMENPVPTSPSTAIGRSTTHITTTIMVTLYPSVVSLPLRDEGVETTTLTVTSTLYLKPSLPSFHASSFDPPANSSVIAPSNIATVPSTTILRSEVPWCVTVADVAWNGQYVPVGGGPAGPDDKCSSPPTYTGLPYGHSQPTSSSSSTVPFKDLKSITLPTPTPSSCKVRASSASASLTTSMASSSAIVAPQSSIVPVASSAIVSIPTSSVTPITSSSSQITQSSSKPHS
jgi:glucan endo-1,3-beta-D-glucosidase